MIFTLIMNASVADSPLPTCTLRSRLLSSLHLGSSYMMGTASERSSIRVSAHTRLEPCDGRQWKAMEGLEPCDGMRGMSTRLTLSAVSQGIVPSAMGASQGAWDVIQAAPLPLARPADLVASRFQILCRRIQHQVARLRRHTHAAGAHPRISPDTLAPHPVSYPSSTSLIP